MGEECPKHSALENKVSALEIRQHLENKALGDKLKGVEETMEKLSDVVRQGTWRVLGGMGVIIMFLLGIVVNL